MLSAIRSRYAALPKVVRRTLSISIKALVTVAAFYFLLSAKIPTEDGGRIAVIDAIRENLAVIEPSTFWPFVLGAGLIKLVGVFASMFRWHLLLIGQGIRFNFSHVVKSFLIGRFIGTFLPSTIGLDSYKLYDAAKFSNRVVEPAAATAVEKVMGLSGVFLTFLVALPLGMGIFEEHASTVASVTVPLSLMVIGGLFAVLFRPELVLWTVRLLPTAGRERIREFVNRVSKAASAYRGRGGLIGTTIGLSFAVHFCTAAMYFFTALAVGAVGASFWEVTLASSIQIFATVMSPFTIAGEGIREIVQALLLAKKIGASQSILSAALGFWAGEAVTSIGAWFLWTRRPDYRPAIVDVAAHLSDTHDPEPEGDNGDNGDPLLAEAS
ncbi:MAG: lysylphosphatidylglycerol synthase transmembrane domain-containing protein [Myxococcota bacterium]